MEVAADILDDLLPAGNLVSVKDKQGNVTVEFTSDAKEVGLPMTALVNDKTYGPAELFAAAIRQYKKIGLVGETTAGSGAKNKVLALSDGSAIIFSVASYITPEGAEFDGVGIEPDHPVVLTEGQRAQLNRKLLSDANDPQMQTALNVLSEAGVDTAPPVSEPEASAESAQSEEAAQ